MSAHLSNLFGKELDVPEWQQQSYLEAYLGEHLFIVRFRPVLCSLLERLSRYQLHVAAAYVRKNTTHTAIHERTQVSNDKTVEADTC